MGMDLPFGITSNSGNRNSERPPGPRPLPILGNDHQLRRGKLDFYDRLADEYGDVIAYQISSNDVYLIRHPEYIRQILHEQSGKFGKSQAVKAAIEPLVGDGLFVSEGSLWRRQRELMQPAFTMDKIREYLKLMAKHVETFITDWADGQQIRIEDEMKRLALQILSQELFGWDVRDDEAIIDEMSEVMGNKRAASWVPDWLPTPTKRAYRRALSNLDDFVYEAIEEKRQSDDDATDLLSMIVTAETTDGEQMSDEQIRDELVTLLFAGYETTTRALATTWYLLARHPGEREQLHADVDAVLESKRLTMSDLSELDHVSRVVTETMRLYPPVFRMFREARTDAEVGDWTIPAGTTVVIPQWLVHRDERFHPDPTTFNPGRWTDAYWKDLPEYAYFPFGGGKRHCIGMRFARTEIRLVVATIARRFRLDLVDDEPISFGAGAVRLDPERPMEMTVRSR